jgi:hypothetical protein
MSKPPGVWLMGPFVPTDMSEIKREPPLAVPLELPPLELPAPLELLLEVPAPLDELPLDVPGATPLDELVDPADPLLEPPLPPLEELPPPFPPPLLLEEHPTMTPTAPRLTTAIAVRKSFVAMNAPKHLS